MRATRDADALQKTIEDEMEIKHRADDLRMA